MFMQPQLRLMVIKVTTSAAHEDGKADYSAEVSTLASAGGDAVAVIGYLDQGGKGIIQGSLDSGPLIHLYYQTV